ncbi:MAG TPA: dihydrodipicolinate reductase [Dehalococcoidia bacterium]|nr:dihydrodipicolinate reductase [Dehalococcoidia bacterium]
MSDASFRDILERESPRYAPRPHDIEAYVQGERIRTIHYGIGAIGSEIVRTVLNNPDFEIVGAIDAHPSKAGRDLGEAAGLGRSIGIPVSYEAEPVLRDMYADVVIHTTGSSMMEVYSQLMPIVAAEKSVISTCEELSFPWIRYPELSQKLDRRARDAGVRVLGTGVNPGFVMDLLPLFMLSATQQVKTIAVERVVDVSTRRIQLQRKVGVGLSVKAFQEAAGAGGLGHVGLRESLLMIADTLAWKLEDVRETIEPVVARDKKNTEYFSVDRGYTAGLKQSVVGMMNGRAAIRLDLEMSLGARDPHDTVQIDGSPPIKVTIPGGVSGDLATAAVVVNCIPSMARGRATGLLTMRDLPLLPYFRPRAAPRDE